MSVEVLSLEPAQLAAPVPIWELGIRAGAVGVAVIDGSARDWRAAADALTELPDAPVLTLGVVRGTSADDSAAACDLVVAGDDADGRVRELLARVREIGAPALVAAQLLRGGDAGVVGESLAYSTLLAGDGFAAWRGAHPAREPGHRSGARIALERAGVAWKLRLSRPERHNAFDAQMREELCDALDAIRSEPPAPVVLLGAGPSFCSGGDLDEFGTAAPVAAHLIRTGRSVARRLRRLSPRLVAGVQGRCIGAGVEFAAFAQRLIATPDATFALPELSLGLNLGAGGSISIPARIGRRRTLELLLRGEAIDARRALEWGLVDELAEPGALERRCLHVAEALA
jgi:enoyl-CoA hydratase/carnithine racemase